MLESKNRAMNVGGSSGSLKHLMMNRLSAGCLVTKSKLLQVKMLEIQATDRIKYTFSKVLFEKGQKHFQFL